MKTSFDGKWRCRRASVRIFLAGLAGSLGLAVSTHGADAGSLPPSVSLAGETKKTDESLVAGGGKKETGFVFSLFPKSLQKNPPLDLTVITEMTEAGRRLPPVSPQQPAYYVLQSGGFREAAETTGITRPMTAAEVEGVLQKSLATNGYLPVPSGPMRPTLLIVYTWGAYNGGASEPIFGSRKAFLGRAVMIGGQKFAHQLADILEQVDDLKQAAIPPEVFEFANALHQYELGDLSHEALVDQAALELYYVVASAYDYAAAATNQRRLLWRTRMTVSSAGLSQSQSLPPLIASAGPYFGKDVPEPQVLTRRVHDGKVEIGAPKVVNSSETTAPTPTPPAP